MKFGFTVSSSSPDTSSGDESCVWISGDENDGGSMEKSKDKQSLGVQNISSHGLLEQTESATHTTTSSLNHSALVSMLKENKMNWISFVEKLKLNINNLSEGSLEELVKDLASFIPKSDLTDAEKNCADQSYQAYLAVRQGACREDQEFVTESESDDPEDWVQLKEATAESSQLQNKIKKQAIILKKYKKRLIAKDVARLCILKRKVPNRVSKTVLKYPNIGKDIEKFARENPIGADSWRKTGLLTFSGNTKRGPKLTYKRIQAHLEEKYGVRFGYGTVVQLCCVKNKRKLSAKRYFGVAKIVSKRARKGFSVKLNVDAHWSCALYNGLDFLQLKDGRDKMILNRDDAAGFRLDSTFTHKQHKILAEAGNPELTTRTTDFLNKYTATLQTSSYMFLETETTPETCIGVVKAHKVHHKNPAQHASDLEMLESNDEAKSSLAGQIDCIRVDGATDEGPSHYEVQFMWTERHINHGKICTMVTTRFAGGSYLNKVELQNGCLALGHSNVYIPSTIHGSNIVNGELDQEKLCKNLEAAITVYTNTVNGSPCGGKPIHLTRGSTDEFSKKKQERRNRLLIFLRESKKKKKELQEGHPEEYNYFLKIWRVREDHMVKDLPENYILMLVPCYKRDCVHPVCRKGCPEKEATWFKDGPPITFIPLPIPDPKRPFGGNCENCKQNKQNCTGHYLPPELQYEWTVKNGMNYSVQPPSKILKIFAKTHATFTEDDVKLLASECLLSESDVQMWLENVNNGKKRKAATQNKSKRVDKNQKEDENEKADENKKDDENEKDDDEDDDVYCICMQPWDGRFMIQCDTCEMWYHGSCVGIEEDEADLIDDYQCDLCG
ncbi:Chromatin modification-related YNG2 [Paramuricea clavata]|uniref:Chromatin modification-related YNG2 n=1 Tax=Paramuricea clavata TaxID=317549 RepID=A0A7D9EDI6_PARCT|nr:Chromatin modification-related YNG2 [Paramuricea clavata]